MKDLLAKYNLPKRVSVKLDRAKEGGFVVKFPKLPGCFTQVEDLSQLDDNVTDAVLTYFDVPRSKAHMVIYVPKIRMISRKRIDRPYKTGVPDKFDLFVSA